MTNDYVSLFLNSPISIQEPTAFFALMFLFLGRMLPIIALAPFFGSRILPHPVKVTFALSLFAIFFPQLVFVTTTPIDFNFSLLLYMVKEIFVGTLLGFMISIPFIIVQSAGIIIDHQRGGASLMVNDPTIQSQSSPFGALFNYVLIFIFFITEGPFLVLDAISQSYNVLPPDQFLNPNFFSQNSQVLMDLIKVMGQVMIISTQLAAPALIMILMTDFFLGIANRLAPQVQITFLGMPLKSLLAIAVIFFGWQLFTNQLMTESFTWIRYINNLVNLLQPAPQG